ncbi:uncharacterized protein [Primulina eburnea]|uniref:uncharacterized protein n=1 Tax=Primulina eburnea TaxID=1245227 RepID=UPI003C6C8A2E
MSEIKEKFDPALSITNVKSVIPITLDNETGQYHSWAALFKVQLRVHNLLEHIHPPTEAKEKEIYEAKKAADPELWRRLDAAVLQWIYSTISPDLLHAILFKDDSAEAAWVRLEGIFRDNKGSRATHLEEELAAVDFANFSSIDAYCNHVKSLADRLADVDANVTNSRLVLKLTGGLPEAYSGVVDYIQNQDPLPTFENCRSRIKLRERTIKSAAAKEGGGATSLLATANGTQPLDDAHSPNTAGRTNNNHSKNKKKNYGEVTTNPTVEGITAVAPPMALEILFLPQTHSSHVPGSGRILGATGHINNGELHGPFHRAHFLLVHGSNNLGKITLIGHLVFLAQGLSRFIQLLMLRLMPNTFLRMSTQPCTPCRSLSQMETTTWTPKRHLT